MQLVRKWECWTFCGTYFSCWSVGAKSVKVQLSTDRKRSCDWVTANERKWPVHWADVRGEERVTSLRTSAWEARERPDGHTFLCKFWHFQMAVSWLLLGLLAQLKKNSPVSCQTGTAGRSWWRAWLSRLDKREIYTKLGDFVKLGLHLKIVWITVVANPIIYRLVPSPSQFEN